MQICCPEQTESFREGSFFSSTQSICPTCRKTVQAKIFFRDNKVFIKKRCLEHGETEALISSDMNYWTKSLSYTKPGQIPLKNTTQVEKGCPDDCGLCEDHEQHTCTPIVEISNKCDLECPICIVWNKNDYDMPYDDFKFAIDNLVACEGKLEVLLLSGGEPTLHPEFFKLAEYATSKSEIKRVIISSHGLKIARDEEFAKRFMEMGLYLSLQFDSLKSETYIALRGKNLLEEKMECLKKCEKYDIPTIFVPTVAKGVNEEEVGAIVDFALAHDFVTSVVIQPAAYTGAGGTAFPQDEMKKLTQPDIHQLLESQTTWLKRDDFLPIPCSHPTCYSATFALKTDENEFVPITRFGDIDTYLNTITNRGIMDGGSETAQLIQDASYNLWSTQSLTVDSEKINNALKDILTEYKKVADKSEADKVFKYSETKIKAIFVHSFMDEYDFDISRLKKCCTHYVLDDGRLMPGCSYNNINRFKDERLHLGNVDIPERKKL